MLCGAALGDRGGDWDGVRLERVTKREGERDS